uniref:Uncharacterized protein n=1 Tax=Arundo donax TaxID=35708 RepID=A0A0A9GF59_ARUDO
MLLTTVPPGSPFSFVFFPFWFLFAC